MELVLAEARRTMRGGYCDATPDQGRRTNIGVIADVEEELARRTIGIDVAGGRPVEIGPCGGEGMIRGAEVLRRDLVRAGRRFRGRAEVDRRYSSMPVGTGHKSG